MLYNSVLDMHFSNVFLNLSHFLNLGNVHLKLEGFNRAGSIKLKTALSLVEGLEKKHILTPGLHKIVESSSGNLGIALSIVCSAKGYGFTCVTDPSASQETLNLIHAYGGKTVIVTERDKNDGYLLSRIKYIKDLLSKDSSYIWMNQYANQENTLAHYRTTAQEIFNDFSDRANYLFIGTGTTGTLVGCARFFQEFSPGTKIIAVEPVGSVTFGRSPGKRFLPGLGTSRQPEIFSTNNISDVVYVSEADTVQMCHRLLSSCQLLAGASTGTVVAGIEIRHISTQEDV